MDISTELATGLASLVGGLFGLLKSFRFVQEGERGIKLQFGKAIRDQKGLPKIIEPGFVFLIPLIQSLRRHHIRQQSRCFAQQRVTLNDGLIYVVRGMVIFRIYDVYRAMFDIDDVDKSIDDLCMAAIRDEFQTVSHRDLRDLGSISTKLGLRVVERAKEWGVEILQFSLTECAPTPETAHLINAATGVELRLAALLQGLKTNNLSLQDVTPNLAAVLVGIPITAMASDNSSSTALVEQVVDGADNSQREIRVEI